MNARNLHIVAALTTLALSLSACSSGNSGLDSGDSRVVWSHTKVAGITTSNFLLTLSATLLPPTVGGTTLAANSVALSGTNAFVSYNLPGSQVGALDLVNVVVPALPVRTTSLSLPTTSVNGATAYNNTIFTVGAVHDPSTLTNNTGWPAVVSSVSLSGSTLAVTNTVPLQQTYTGTGVTAWNGKLYAISGGGGSSVTQGLTMMDPSSLGVAATVQMVEPRDLNYYYGGGTDLWVVTGNAGNGGQLIDVNSSNAVVKTVSIGGNVTPESKSTVQVGKTMVAVSKSEAGVAIVCQADGAILKTIAAPTGVPGFTNAQTVSNAVAAGPGLLFVANGEAGVYVYTMTKSVPTTSSCNNVAVNLIGTINLGDATYSANNVTYVAGSLFVATGLGGFKVITVTVLSPLFNGNLDFM